MQKKLVMLFMAIILAFVVLIGRITFINVFKGGKYTKIVLDQQQYGNKKIPYKRGDIVDRNGTKMATSERVYNVILDVVVITDEGKSEKYIDPTLEALEECFQIDPDEVKEIIDDNPQSRYEILKKGVSYADAQKFQKTIEEDQKKKENQKEGSKIQGIWLEED